MAKQKNRVATFRPSHPYSHFAGQEANLLFWIKLLVFFLGFNILFYSLELATRLSGCALPPPPRATLTTAEQLPSDQPRSVTVLAVADGWYRTTHPQWQETITHDISLVSQLYEKVSGITFELVEIRAWDTPAVLTMTSELAMLKRAYPITDTYEVVMGFTAGSGLIVAGISEVLGNHLLVAATPFHGTVELLAHELGHIFGARDTVTTSTTQLFLGPFAPALLPQNFREAIHEHRLRPFRLPPASQVPHSVVAEKHEPS